MVLLAPRHASLFVVDDTRTCGIKRWTDERTKDGRLRSIIMSQYKQARSFSDKGSVTTTSACSGNDCGCAAVRLWRILQYKKEPKDGVRFFLASASSRSRRFALAFCAPAFVPGIAVWSTERHTEKRRSSTALRRFHQRYSTTR